MDGAVYFVSDTHFGSGSQQAQADRRRRFLAWLDSLTDASHLYLLGDLFDFWLDYPNFMPKTHLEVLDGLRRLRDRGVELAFVGGNHDMWCARYLQATLGVRSLLPNSVAEHQGVRVRMNHGDGLLTGDLAYKAFRAAVRNPATVLLARALHPELVHWMAARLSHASRRKKRHGVAQLRLAVDRYGHQHDHSDVDYLAVGHLHVPLSIPFAGWTFVCLGDWVEHHTAGRLVGGALTVGPVGEDPAEAARAAALSARSALQPRPERG
jgi:UDP-2,3-diacylglucosamine hydrolase